MRLRATVLTLFALLGIVSLTAQAQVVRSARPGFGSYIVILEDDVDVPGHAAMLQALSKGHVTAVYSAALHGFAIQTTIDRAEAIARHPKVAASMNRH